MSAINALDGSSVAKPPILGLRRLLGRTAALSGLSLAGQAIYLVALPLLSHLFTPTAVGLFTLYLSAVNIAGPLVGGRFEAALFGLRDRGERRLVLALALLSSLCVAPILAAFLLGLAPHLNGNLRLFLTGLWPILPLGFALSGFWAATSAWAISEDALSVLAWARFIQPAILAALQVLCGMQHLPASSLIVAHVASHAAFSGFILWRTLSYSDVRSMLRTSRAALVRRAVADWHFPAFAMPAFLVVTLVANAPPILMGGLYGAAFAGQYGIAYRVVTGPLSILCQPLGQIFLSEAGQGGVARTRGAARFAFILSLVVAFPVLIIGLMAPRLSLVILGPEWTTAGAIMAALAAMGAAQAIAAPFAEVPSLLRRPKLRLIVDAIQGVLFFAPLAVGTSAGWDPISTIWLMAAGGALGYSAGAVLTLNMLRLAMKADARKMAP